MPNLINKTKLKYIWSLLCPYLIIFVVAMFILWPQATNHAFFIGADSVFHMNRFYESAMQIKKGHISWFLNLYGFNQSGRIVNALYGPVFSYLAGGLLLILGNWVRFQIVLSLITLILSGSFMYRLSRFCNIRRSFSICLGLIYMSSFPVDTWINEQTFSGVGATIMPLVILEGLKIAKSHQIKIIPLAILITLLAQIHIMSTIISVLTLIPFLAFSFWQCEYKSKWIKKLFISMFAIIGLTGNIWGSLWEVFGTNHIIPPFPETDMSNPAYAIMWDNGNLSLLSNIYIIIGILTIVILIIYRKHLRTIQKILIGSCIFFLWLSSVYFPWSTLSRHLIFIQQTIQFPKRFISTFIVLLLVIFGQGLSFTLKKFSTDRSIVPFLIMIIFVILSGTSISQENHTITTHAEDWTSKQISITTNSLHPKMKLSKIRKAYTSHNLSLGIKYFVKSTPDYLPSNRNVNARNFKHLDPYDLLTNELLRINVHPYHTKTNKVWYGAQPIQNRLHFHRLIKGHQLLIRWHQPRKRNDAILLLPAVKYQHTQVKLNHTLLHHVKTDKIGGIRICAKKGNNQISLRYHASLWWLLTIYITVSSWLTLIYIIVNEYLINKTYNKCSH